MRYDSFRLRVWRGTRHGRVQWAARLEGLQDGVEHRFNLPEALFEHLRQVLDLDPPAGTTHGEPATESPNQTEQL